MNAEDYLPLVRKLANAYRKRLPRTVEFDDLVHAGVIGLLQALERYEPSQGSFEGYAVIRVRGAMADWLRKEDLVGRTGRRHGVENLGSLDALKDATEFEPSSPPGTNGTDARSDVDGALACLSKQERLVLRLRHEIGMEVLDVARILGIKPSRAYAIQKRALGKAGGVSRPPV